MVELGAILATANQRIAAVGHQQVDSDLLLVARIDLVDDMRQHWIHDAVVEPAGELRIVAEGVEPEADGSGGEDALPWQMGVQPFRGLVLDGGADVDSLSQAARIAALANSDWKTGQGCRHSESEGGAARNPR